MKNDSIKKFIMPPGPLLTLMLIGLLLLSAILYYRAVKIQRFLEPALAITQPRIKFTQGINKLLMKEFGTKEIAGIKFRMGSIFVDQSILFESAHSRTEPTVLKKLGRVFLSALDNEDMREHISLILVCARMPLTRDREYNRFMRFRTQDGAGLIINSLYAAEPELEMKYGTFFASAALVAGNPKMQEGNWIEFRIVPTERLHIEVLQRFEKYMQ